MSIIEVKSRDTLASRLGEARKAAGLSQSELARRAGLTPAAVSQIERGEREPSAETLRRLVPTLGVSADWLLGLTAEPELTPEELRRIHEVEARLRELVAEASRLRKENLALEAGPLYRRTTYHGECHCPDCRRLQWLREELARLEGHAE